LSRKAIDFRSVKLSKSGLQTVSEVILFQLADKLKSS